MQITLILLNPKIEDDISILERKLYHRLHLLFCSSSLNVYMERTCFSFLDISISTITSPPYSFTPFQIIPTFFADNQVSTNHIQRKIRPCQLVLEMAFFIFSCINFSKFILQQHPLSSM